MKAEERIKRMRTRLLLDNPWFGTLALKITPTLTDEKQCPTMATDGTRLYYSETFVKSLTDAELVGVLAHEVMHCAMLHMYRKGSKDMRKWNIACDCAINPLIKNSGLTLPKDTLDDAKYHDMSAEEIYAKLPSMEVCVKSGLGSGDGKDGRSYFTDGNGGNGDDDGNKDGNGKGGGMTAVDWQIAAEQAAAVARMAGKMPGDIDKMLGNARKSKTDWRTLLRRFIEQTIPSDYSWSHPNRRYIGSNMYLPGVIKENAPRIGIGVDTSGSISDHELNIVGEEMTAILHEVMPVEMEVVYCDTIIQNIEKFTPDDSEVVFHAKGRGGTSFQPVFDHFNADPPAVVIFMSADLENGDTVKEPADYPVLWISTPAAHRKPSFGEHVVIEE